MLPARTDLFSVPGHHETPHRATLAAVPSTIPSFLLRWMRGAVGTYE
jgi:hypothetical protein